MQVYLLKLRDCYSRLAAKKKAVWVLVLSLLGSCLLPSMLLRILGELLFLHWLVGWALACAVPADDSRPGCRDMRMLKQLITANLLLYTETPGWRFAEQPEDTQAAKLLRGDTVQLILDDKEYDRAEIRMKPGYAVEVTVHNTTREWYEAEGKTMIEELVYDRAAQGQQSVQLRPESLQGLPKDMEKLLPLLEGSGLDAKMIAGSGIQITI